MTEPMTRDCTDPWETVFVNSAGEVRLCCWSGSVGRLEGGDLEAIVEGEAAREFRAGLLSGELPPDCVRCKVRGRATVSDLTEQVRALGNPGVIPESFATRRRIRTHESRIVALEEERGQILDHQRDFRKSPLRLARALVRSLLTPLLGPPKSWWESSETTGRESRVRDDSS